MRTFAILIFLMKVLSGSSQNITINEANRKLSTIFHEREKRAEVLLLGTFHFSYLGLDAHQTPDSLQVDVLSKQKQREIEEVVSILQKFKPTRIAVEVLPERQAVIDSLFLKYKEGQLRERRGETFQLGFRLAKNLNHTKVYCIDAKPFVKTLYEMDTLLAKKYNLDKDKVFARLDSMYEDFYTYDYVLQKSMSLKDYLLLINSDTYLKYDHGRYLTYTRNGTNLEPIGADGFISKWFNRNVRIFSNIQRLADDPSERILVIIGGAHVPMLQFLIQSSQELRLREFREIVK
jgi:hypothetical protein